MANNASVNQTLADIALDAQALNASRLDFNQTLQSVALLATAELGRVLEGKVYLGEATLVGRITMGEAPFPLPLKPALYNLTGPVRESGGAILCFQGPPWKTIEWRIVQGTGTLTPYTTFTDALGRASCRFDPGYKGGIKTIVVVGAAYVP